MLDVRGTAGGRCGGRASQNLVGDILFCGSMLLSLPSLLLKLFVLSYSPAVACAQMPMEAAEADSSGSAGHSRWMTGAACCFPSLQHALFLLLLLPRAMRAPSRASAWRGRLPQET